MTTMPVAVPASAEHASIRTFADILLAMEQDPAIAEAVRQHVLDDELRQLPAAFRQLAATVEDYMVQTNGILSELKAGQAHHDSDIAELKAGQARLEAGQARLENGHLELAAKFLPLDVQRMTGSIADLLNIRTVTWLDGVDLLEIIDEAQDNGAAVPASERQSFHNIDLAMRGVGRETRQREYVVIECSNTVDRHDITRIRRNADLMARLTNCRTHALVAGNRLPEHIRSEAAEAGVHTIPASTKVTRAT